MTSNKSREELIEMVYSLTADVSKLQYTSSVQHKLLDEIYTEVTIKDGWWAGLVRWFKLNKTLITLLNEHEDYHFNTLMLDKNNSTMNKQEIIEALEYINAMHKNTISIETYRDYVGKTTDLDVCKGCGKTKKILHNKHQRLISHNIKNNHPEMAVPVTFISNKYGSDFYHNSVPLNSYDDLSLLTSQLLFDIKYGKSRGGQEEQVHLMERDLITLTEYIDKRVNYKYVDSIESIAPSVEVEEKPSIDESDILKVEVTQKDESTPIDESTPTLVEVASLDKVNTHDVIEWNIDDALLMKQEGKSHKAIGLVYGVSGATVGRRFKAVK